MDEAPDARPGERPGPPTSRAVAMFAVVLAVLALIAFAAWFAVAPTEERFCTADGRLGPNGESYGRDPDQGCQFVDDDGNVVPG